MADKRLEMSTIRTVKAEHLKIPSLARGGVSPVNGAGGEGGLEGATRKWKENLL